MLVLRFQGKTRQVSKAGKVTLGELVPKGR